MSKNLVRLSQYREVLHIKREKCPTLTVCGIMIIKDLNVYRDWRPHQPTLCMNCGTALGGH